MSGMSGIFRTVRQLETYIETTKASFCCNKIVRNLHLFLTKIAVKSCIYAQAFHITVIYSSNLSVGRVVEWLKHLTVDQHGLGSKPTCAILLCSWKRHFTALSPAWWS